MQFSIPGCKEPLRANLDKPVVLHGVTESRKIEFARAFDRPRR